ncbi:hypothetical protein [Candidatus Sororendozoicomonas aggregata]|uniref:hypothetical protein n=1 Tax=Candidatus Sororendozoicomonas aggregata TaxID=3073239 RepID=UPI002ED16B86
MPPVPLHRFRSAGSGRQWRWLAGEVLLGQLNGVVAIRIQTVLEQGSQTVDGERVDTQCLHRGGANELPLQGGFIVIVVSHDEPPLIRLC